MDVASIVVSIVGVVAEGIKISNTVTGFVDRVRTAPREIRSIAHDVRSTSDALQQIGISLKSQKAQVSDEWYETTSDHIKACKAVFAEINQMIEQSQLHSEEDGVSFSKRDRFRHAFNHPKVSRLRNELSYIKADFTFKLAVLACTRAHDNKVIVETSTEDSSKRQLASIKFEKQCLDLQMAHIELMNTNEKHAPLSLIFSESDRDSDIESGKYAIKNVQGAPPGNLVDLNESSEGPAGRPDTTAMSRSSNFHAHQSKSIRRGGKASRSSLSTPMGAHSSPFALAVMNMLNDREEMTVAEANNPLMEIVALLSQQTLLLKDINERPKAPNVNLQALLSTPNSTQDPLHQSESDQEAPRVELEKDLFKPLHHSVPISAPGSSSSLPTLKSRENGLMPTMKTQICKSSELQRNPDVHSEVNGPNDLSVESSFAIEQASNLTENGGPKALAILEVDRASEFPSNLSRSDHITTRSEPAIKSPTRSTKPRNSKHARFSVEQLSPSLLGNTFRTSGTTLENTQNPIENDLATNTNNSTAQNAYQPTPRSEKATERSKTLKQFRDRMRQRFSRSGFEPQIQDRPHISHGDINGRKISRMTENDGENELVNIRFQPEAAKLTSGDSFDAEKWMYQNDPFQQTKLFNPEGQPLNWTAVEGNEFSEFDARADLPPQILEDSLGEIRLFERSDNISNSKTRDRFRTVPSTRSRISDLRHESPTRKKRRATGQISYEAWSLRRARADSGSMDMSWLCVRQIHLPIQQVDLLADVTRYESDHSLFDDLARLSTYQQRQIDRLLSTKQEGEISLHHEWVLAALKTEPARAKSAQVVYIQVIIKRIVHDKPVFVAVDPAPIVPPIAANHIDDRGISGSRENEAIEVFGMPKKSKSVYSHSIPRLRRSKISRTKIRPGSKYQKITRKPNIDELATIDFFCRHASHCAKCYNICQGGSTDLSLCSIGEHYAKDIGLLLYSKLGVPYAYADNSLGSIAPDSVTQIDIPMEYEIIYGLFTAVDNGLVKEILKMRPPGRRAMFNHSSSGGSGGSDSDRPSESGSREELDSWEGRNNNSDDGDFFNATEDDSIAPDRSASQVRNKSKPTTTTTTRTRTRAAKSEPLPPTTPSSKPRRKTRPKHDPRTATARPATATTTSKAESNVSDLVSRWTTLSVVDLPPARETVEGGRRETSCRKEVEGGPLLMSGVKSTSPVRLTNGLTPPYAEFVQET